MLCADSGGRYCSCLLAWPILVVGVLLEVQQPESLGLLDERLTINLVQQAPSATQLLADLGVVHVRLHFGNLSTLNLEQRTGQ